MDKMKAISPVIATIIIVAVAVAISIALVGWIMGLWGTFTGGTETLQIMPDSKLYSNGNLTLHVVNKGTAAAIVYKVEVVGVGSATSFNYTSGTTPTTTDNEVTITPGGDMTIIANVTSGGGTVNAGASYLVKVYTKSGNVWSISLVAEQSQH